MRTHKSEKGDIMFATIGGALKIISLLGQTTIGKDVTNKVKAITTGPLKKLTSRPVWLQRRFVAALLLVVAVVLGLFGIDLTLDKEGAATMATAVVKAFDAILVVWSLGLGAYGQKNKRLAILLLFIPLLMFAGPTEAAIPVTLSWAEVADADGYTLYHKATVPGSGVTITIEPGDDSAEQDCAGPPCTWQDVDAALVNCWKLDAYNANGRGGYSEFACRPPGVLPGTPGNLRVQ